MFLEGESYSRAVKLIATTSEPVDMAIAFWGSGASRMLTASLGAHRRIVCDLVSGGTNPDEVRKLCTMSHVTVKHCKNLHAKVLVTDTQALIGSANFSANGVGWEEGMAGKLVEAGYHVLDMAQVRGIQAWFDKLFDTSEPITDNPS